MQAQCPSAATGAELRELACCLMAFKTHDVNYSRAARCSSSTVETGGVRLAR